MIGFSVLGVVLVVQASQPAPVVTISAAQIARAQRLTIAGEPVWRIGGEAEGPYSFARIVGGTFMRNGRVAVLEFTPPQVRVFDADGMHQFTFGRLGQGPGEFSQVQRLTPHAGDSLVVSQIGRVSVFDAIGQHARTMNTASAGVGLAIVHRMLSDGSMLASSRPLPTPHTRHEGIARDSFQIVKLSPNAAAIAHDYGKVPIGETVIAHVGGGGFAMRARPFSPGTLLDAADSLILSMNTSIPQLDVHSSAGRLLRTLRAESSYRSVTARDRDQVERQLHKDSRDPRIRDAFLRVITFPERMPYFDRLSWSYDRVVRLRRYVAPLDSTAQWLSLTPAGQLVSVIDVPAKARVLDFDRDRVLLVERDADDLEYLALYKLIPSKR